MLFFSVEFVEFPVRQQSCRALLHARDLREQAASLQTGPEQAGQEAVQWIKDVLSRANDSPGGEHARVQASTSTTTSPMYVATTITAIIVTLPARCMTISFEVLHAFAPVTKKTACQFVMTAVCGRFAGCLTREGACYASGK
jgi:hypothetical protein